MPTRAALRPPTIVGAAIAAAAGVAVRIGDQTVTLGDLHVHLEAAVESIASTATADPLPMPVLAGPIDWLVAAIVLASLPVTGRMLVGQAAAGWRVHMWRRREGL